MDPNKPDGNSGKAPSDRPLPRGLEDVSHLFLSRSQSERPIPELAPVSKPEILVALRPCPLHSREQLVTLIRKQPNALEQGMRVIDTNLPCDSVGTIEVVALSSVGQLTIIDVAEGTSDALVVRGMNHADWVARNLPIVRRMYAAHAINYSFPPRLFLVASEFSPGFQSVARQITSVQIHALKYHAVALSGGIGVLFEHVVV
jgi:hypothetical protein